MYNTNFCFSLIIDHNYAGQRKRIRRIFNWHTKEYIALPLPLIDHTYFSNVVVGMIVDTSVWPYAFKVIESSGIDTMIYDSTTYSWTYQLPPMGPNSPYYRRYGSANVASCKGVAFMVDYVDQIVLYDTKKDKWDLIKGPQYRLKKELCGIGSWNDRIFSSTYCMSENAMTIEIQELVDMAEPEWKEFAAMPGEMCSWLKDGVKNKLNLKIDMSFCSENLLIWAWDVYSTAFNSGLKRHVLCNLAHKTWVKLELPLLPLTDPGPGSWMMKSKLEEDEVMEEGMGTDKGKGKAHS